MVKEDRKYLVQGRFEYEVNDEEVVETYGKFADSKDGVIGLVKLFLDELHADKILFVDCRDEKESSSPDFENPRLEQFDGDKYD